MEKEDITALSGVPETMLQTVYARAKESAGRGNRSDYGLCFGYYRGQPRQVHWGVKNGSVLVSLLPGFRLVEEHSLTEGMSAFVPIYELLDKVALVRNISNKIIVLERN